MYWPFGATVCMWAILYPSCLCCLMICRFQWERMPLQTAEKTLIQMSHIQVLAPKGQHIQKAKIWTFECTENAMEKLKCWVINFFSRLPSLPFSISVTEHSMTVCDNMNLCVFWNVQHTNETEWRCKKFPLNLTSQTCRNCVWGQLIWGRY